MLNRKVGLIGIKCLIDKWNVGSLPYGITDFLEDTVVCIIDFSKNGLNH